MLSLHHLQFSIWNSCVCLHTFFALMLRTLFLLLSKWINGSNSRENPYEIYPYCLLYKISTRLHPSVASAFYLSIGVIYKLEVSESISFNFWGFSCIFFFLFWFLLFLLQALNAHLLACSLFLSVFKCLCKRVRWQQKWFYRWQAKSNGNRKT